MAPKTTVRPGTSDAATAKALKKVSDELKKATDGGEVNNAEWEKVVPNIENAPLESGVARLLLDVYADKAISFEEGAGIDAGMLLKVKGYEVELRYVDRDGKSVVPDLRVAELSQGNMAEKDAAFDALSAKLKVADRRISVAVVDGGFVQHPLLQDNLNKEPNARGAQPGYFIGKKFGEFTPAQEKEGAVHGTHVTGIVTRGTSRIDARLYAIPLEAAGDRLAGKRLRSNGAKLQLDAVEAAAKDGAKVINISVESFLTSAQATQFQKLISKYPNVLFVFGAGNDGFELGSTSGTEKSLVESLRLPNLVVVAASLPDGGRWGSSNYGDDWVALAARGHQISSADSGSLGLLPESGTSMAAPGVTNAAAKCLVLNPLLTPPQVVQLLAITSDPDPDWKGKVASGGTINTERAMQAAAALTLVKQGRTVKAALAELGIEPAQQPAIKKAVAALGEKAPSR